MWWGYTWRFLLMAAISAVVWANVDPDHRTDHVALDLLGGAACFALVAWRRRWPVPVAVVTAAVSCVSILAAGPATLALVSLATRRRWREVLPLGVISVAGAQAFLITYPTVDSEPWWLTLSTNALVLSAAIAWGMFIGSRRELMWTLRARAERAEAEQELRAAQSRLSERSRIAREMHDVLAHRISHISMQAGALSYRDDLSAHDLRGGLGVIRDAANAALTDLRDVLGVLRETSGEVDHRPQPTFAEISALVDDALAAGMRITFEDDVAGQVPAPLGRTAYRIVQEGITNARKHAPDAEVTIGLEGSPGDRLTVTVSNPLGFAASAPAAPGSGLGLIGLRERAELGGGVLDHGRVGGTFRLRASLPWPA